MTPRASTPAPPKGLTATSARWFRQIAAEFDLDQHHVSLLGLAAQQLDRIAEARARIAKDGGPFVAGRFGVLMPHAGLTVERHAAVLFARLVRELGLPLDNPDDSRPPRVGTGARS